MLRLHLDMPRDLMQDRVNVYAKDGVVRDGDLRTTKERAVARFVQCMIVADGRNRVQSELIGLAGQGLARVLMGPTPRLAEGFVLEEVETRIRYTVRRPEFFPSEHNPTYQVAALDRDVIGEVTPT